MYRGEEIKAGRLVLSVGGLGNGDHNSDVLEEMKLFMMMMRRTMMMMMMIIMIILNAPPEERERLPRGQGAGSRLSSSLRISEKILLFVTLIMILAMALVIILIRASKNCADQFQILFGFPLTFDLK